MKKLVKICQIYLDLHHLLCNFPNFPGGGPPDPPIILGRFAPSLSPRFARRKARFARHFSNFQVFFQNPTGKTVLCFNKVSLYCLQKKLVVLWLYLWTDDNKLLAIILIDLPTPTPFGVDLPLSAKSTPFFLPLSVNYLYEMLCCDLENMMNYKSGSWNFLHLFFYHCLLKKLPFSIWFKLSWKVPGCPRFAPFHFKFWKFSGGGKPPQTPPLEAKPRCARVSEQIYLFFCQNLPLLDKKSTPFQFWGWQVCY